MQFPLKGYVVGLPTRDGYTDRKTGSVGDPTHTVDFLVPEGDSMTVVKVKCTVPFQQKFAPGLLKPGAPAQEATLLVDMTTGKTDTGAAWISYRAVETK